jgi:hypothetical protein
MPHDRDTWLPDTTFMVLWDAAGSRPEIIPFSPANIDSIERNMRGYIATDRWGYKMPEGPWQGLKGQDLWRKAILTARMAKAAPVRRMDLNSILTEEAADTSNYMAKIGESLKSMNVEASDSYPSTEDELEALAMLKKMVAEGYNPSDGLALLGLSDDFVKDFLTEVLTALDKRMAGGRTFVYSNLSWKELIENISREAIRIESTNVYKRTKWQTWFYASWMPGAKIFPSFRFYIEDALAGMEDFK